MTDHDLAISRETFSRILAAVKTLGMGDLFMLKAAYSGRIDFDRMPDKVKELLVSVGKASEGVR